MSRRAHPGDPVPHLAWAMWIGVTSFALSFFAYVAIVPALR